MGCAVQKNSCLLNRHLKGPKNTAAAGYHFQSEHYPEQFIGNAARGETHHYHLRSAMCSREIEAIGADRLSRNGDTKVHLFLDLSSDSQV